MTAQTQNRPLIHPLHLRWSAVLWIAVLWVGSHVVQQRETDQVEFCKFIASRVLIDDPSSIERWQVSADPIWADAADRPLIGWDWARDAQSPLKPRRRDVELRFRHLDRTGHPRLKHVVCTMKGDTLVFLRVDDLAIPIDEYGWPSRDYLEGPEYSHLK